MLPATHLYLGERGRGVVRQPADPLASVSVVERVASVGRRQAEVPARLHRRHVLQAERKLSSLRRAFDSRSAIRRRGRTETRRKRTGTLGKVNGWVGSEKIMNGERRRNSLDGGVGMSRPTALCENRKKTKLRF